MRVNSSILLISVVLGAGGVVLFVVTRGNATPESRAAKASPSGPATPAAVDAGLRDAATDNPPQASQPLRYSFHDGSGSQDMSVIFLPKKRIKVVIDRRRADGCAWSKTLLARFYHVSELSDDNEDMFMVDEYMVEAGQLKCDMVIDLEQGTKKHASISAFKECGNICRLPRPSQMTLVN